MIKADLHMHTTFSDGTYTPEELLDHAKEVGLNIISITDHDTLTSTEDVRKMAAERKITLIPGIEFSTIHKEISIHILGYFVDQNSERVVELLKHAKGSRQERNRKMIELFKQEGIEITWDELNEVAQEDVIARPHFAELLIRKGIVNERQEAFNKYLADDAKCCPQREELPSDVVIQGINDSGGISCLAHPNVYKLKSEDEFVTYLGELKEQGLKALEVYYSKHNPQKAAFFLKLAKKFDLFPLGGSDFHGTNKKNVSLGKFYGIENVYSSIEASLKERGLA